MQVGRLFINGPYCIVSCAENMFQAAMDVRVKITSAEAWSNGIISLVHLLYG
jgi:hypothetical protein